MKELFLRFPRAPLTLVVFFLVARGVAWLLPPAYGGWLLEHGTLTTGTAFLVLLAIGGLFVRGTPIFARDVTGDPPEDVDVQRVPDVERGLAEAGFRPLGLLHLFIPEVLDTVVAFQAHEEAHTFAEPLDLPEGPYVALTTLLEDGYAVTTGWEARFLGPVAEARRERATYPPGPVTELLARHRARVGEVSATRRSPPVPPSRALVLGHERHALSQNVRVDWWISRGGMYGVLLVGFGVLVGVDRLAGWWTIVPVAAGVALVGALLVGLAAMEGPLRKLAVPGLLPARALIALGTDVRPDEAEALPIGSA